MELIGTRKTIHEAFAWGWSRREVNMIEYMLYGEHIETGGYVNTNAMVCDGVEVGFVLSAVSKQRPRVAQWLEFCYGVNNTEFRHEAIASDLFADNFMGNVSGKQISRHQALCWIAVDDYQMRVWQNKQLPIEIYAKGMHVWENNWARDWKDKKEKCLDDLASLDKEGVSNVSIMVRSLRGHSNLTPSEVLSEFDG